jgi:hypothetical protein
LNLRLRGDVGAILDRFGIPISEDPDHHPIKKSTQPGDAFEDTDFKPGFKIVKF